MPLNCIPDALSRPLFTYSLDANHLQKIIIQSNHQISVMNINSHSFSTANSILRFRRAGTLQLSVNVGESTQIVFKPQVNAGLSWNYTIDEEDLVDGESLYVEGDKETERRRKISLANKGKAAWNKGKKHSPETRQLIRERTIEALKDPKVRKKMCGGLHTHSEEIKAKIGLAQKRVWRKRLKLKYEREKYYWIWAESIAEAAKRGWRDQEELEWNSFEKLTAKIAVQQRQRAADKERAKQLAKLRARRETAERMTRRAREKTEKVKKAKFREAERKEQTEKVKKAKSSEAETKEENQELPILKLKARITEIRQRKSVDGQLSITGGLTSASQPDIETVDLEFIKKEKLRREMSLADQIQAAKKKRATSVTKEIPTKNPTKLVLNGRVYQIQKDGS